MTNREAIIAEIEPFSLSDEGIEKAFIDAQVRFPAFGDVDCEYDVEMRKVVAYASMLCLNRLRVLSSENIGGISQSFNVEKIERRIKNIADEAGISPDLLLVGGSDTTVTYMSVW